MPTIDLVVETPISDSVRAAQVSSMFDVPPAQKARLEWHGNLPIEDRPWNVGLIVGPSGCGKSSILNSIFGKPLEFSWTAPSVIDDFPATLGVETISGVCQSVGFNTIPAWLRPYAVLSNGEKFRVDLARRLLEAPDLISCDEFTSVVDRRVAQIGAHAVQKFIRRHERQFVAATCHFDLEDWLQPDWVLEPATMQFRWRSVQRRPDVHCTVVRVPPIEWERFARFHYMSASLSSFARCFELLVDGEPAAFAASLYRPHQKARDIYGLARGVVLPDFQGLGLIFALIDRLGAAYKAIGFRCRSYPAHPGYIRSHDKSNNWTMVRKPGLTAGNTGAGNFGGRPCAVFEYCGPEMSRDDAQLLLGHDRR